MHGSQFLVVCYNNLRKQIQLSFVGIDKVVSICALARVCVHLCVLLLLEGNLHHRRVMHQLLGS